jgi:hypothetical protein
MLLTLYLSLLRKTENRGQVFNFAARIKTRPRFPYVVWEVMVECAPLFHPTFTDFEQFGYSLKAAVASVQLYLQFVQ